jgi:hypothetical protein
MSAAAKTLLAVLALAVAGCGGSPQEPVQANNAAVVSEIEQLPPDESVATTTGELVNGVDEPPPDPMAGNETSP